MGEKSFRRHIFFEGRVQGVGFRYKAVEIAKGYDVAGFVKNIDDGKVELVAVGEKNEVKEYTDALEKSMCDFIKNSYKNDDFTELKYKGFIIDF